MYSANICGHQMDQEFGFYHVGHNNASPEVQSNFVSILGMNGHLDLTEQDGAVFYNSVSREWRFEKVERDTDEGDVDYFAKELRNKLLGENGKIVFDDDPEFYYLGRITKIDVSCEDGGRIVALFTVYTKPFRYKAVETIVSDSVSTSKVIGLSNLKMPVSPYVTVSSQMTLSYTIDGVQYEATVAEGTHVIDTLVLKQVVTFVTVAGSGTISFRYRQGTL